MCKLTIKIPNSKKVKCSINSIIEENSNNNFIEISLCETDGKNERNEKEEKINKEKKNEKNDIFSYVENKIIKQKNRLENTIKNKKDFISLYHSHLKMIYKLHLLLFLKHNLN